MSASEFTHLDPLGRARMVDVTSKEATHRRAIARCRVHMDSDTASKIASGAITKGDVLAVARVAGIQAAKQTPSLLPLCHPLLVGSVFVNFRIEARRTSRSRRRSRPSTAPGVEMEALTACAIAALTIYDMCKSIDRGMTIGELALWEKTGGRSGMYRRPPGSTTTSSTTSERLDGVGLTCRSHAPGPAGSHDPRRSGGQLLPCRAGG